MHAEAFRSGGPKLLARSPKKICGAESGCLRERGNTLTEHRKKQVTGGGACGRSNASPAAAPNAKEAKALAVKAADALPTGSKATPASKMQIYGVGFRF